MTDRHQLGAARLVAHGDPTVTAGAREVTLKLADGSQRVLRPGETLRLVSVPGGYMPRRCSATCDGPGPDVVDQGPDPAQSIDVPCPACGRREPQEGLRD